MKYPILLTADLHLTDSPSTQYRWEALDKLADVCSQNKVRSLCILGDTTDAKDFHSNAFINKLVDALVRLYTQSGVGTIYVIPGNHDYSQRGEPNLAFLSYIPGFRYIDAPTELMGVSDQEAAVVMLPHTRSPIHDWHELSFIHSQFVFMHQTAPGSKASNGQRMDGEQLPDLSGAGKVFSGDIHVPQIVGDIEYVGSPYQVHFGDNFEPRVVLITKQGWKGIPMLGSPARRMLTISRVQDLSGQELRAGDHVKVRVALPPAEHHEWQRRRDSVAAWLSQRGIQCEGIELRSTSERKRLVTHTQPQGRSAEDAVVEYVMRDELGGDVLDAGLDFL